MAQRAQKNYTAHEPKKLPFPELDDTVNEVWLLCYVLRIIFEFPVSYEVSAWAWQCF